MEDEKRAQAAIGYIPPFFWIPLWLAQDAPLAKHHGRQALVIFIATVITWLAFLILRFLLGWIAPFKYFLLVFEGALYFIYIVLTVWGIVKAARGEFWRIPILGAYSDRLKV